MTDDDDYDNYNVNNFDDDDNVDNFNDDDGGGTKRGEIEIVLTFETCQTGHLLSDRADLETETEISISRPTPIVCCNCGSRVLSHALILNAHLKNHQLVKITLA